MSAEGRPNRDNAVMSPDEGEISLLDVAALLLRQRWTILLFVVVIPVLVGVTSFAMPRKWTSTTSFMPQTNVDMGNSQLRSLASQFGFDMGNVPAGQSPQFYADLVDSREVLASVAADTFDVADTTGLFAKEGMRGTLADILNVKVERPALRTDEVIEWLQNKAVSTSTDQETGVVRVSVTTRWPRLSAEIAARIVDLVNNFNLETRKSQATAERRFVEERMDSARLELRVAENALQGFLQKNRAFQESPELAFEHDRLQRQVTMRQQLYTSLVQAYEQARIAEVRNTPVITVVQKPLEPVRPDERHLVLELLVGLILGAFAGLMVAFIRDYMRRERGRNTEDFREVLALWQETRNDVRWFARRFRSP